jgi:hypothetical protein
MRVHFSARVCSVMRLAVLIAIAPHLMGAACLGISIGHGDPAPPPANILYPNQYVCTITCATAVASEPRTDRLSVCVPGVLNSNLSDGPTFQKAAFELAIQNDCNDRVARSAEHAVNARMGTCDTVCTATPNQAFDSYTYFGNKVCNETCAGSVCDRCATMGACGAKICMPQSIDKDPDLVELFASRYAEFGSPLGRTTVIVTSGGVSSTLPAGGALRLYEVPCTGDCTIDASLHITLPPFDFGGRHFGSFSISTGGSRDFQLSLTGGGVLVAPVGSIKFALDGEVDGVRTATFSENSVPAFGGIDFGARSIVFAASAVLESGERFDVIFEASSANLPPKALIAPVGRLECERAGGASTELDGSGSIDEDGRLVRHVWSKQNAQGEFEAFSFDRQVSILSPVGRTTYRLVVVDDGGAMDQAEVTVEVVDTSPPEITVVPTGVCVWPPNNKWSFVGLTNGQEVTVSDRCTTASTLSVVGVEVAEGGAIRPASTTEWRSTSIGVCLLAYREGAASDGRNYLVSLSAADGNGNQTRLTIPVAIPHDQSSLARCRYEDRVSPNSASPCGGGQ